MRTRALSLVIAVGLVLSAGLATSVWAVEPDEMLQDTVLEARARSLSAELRCVVCQNQSIDDSDAPLARDLRRLVRERLTAGDTDEAVKSYIVARYGTFVLLKPPFAPNTLLLWVLPFLIGAAAVVVTYRTLYARSSLPQSDATVLPLDGEEEARLQVLLNTPDSDAS